MRWIHQQDLEIHEGGVFSNPVGVEDSEDSTVTTDTFFSNRLESSSGLNKDTHVNGFTHGSSLGYWLLSSTTSDSDSVYRIPELLCNPIVELFLVELVVKPDGWRSSFGIAKRESVASSASFPIAFCARFRSYICMRPYFNLSVRQSKSDSKMG